MTEQEKLIEALKAAQLKTIENMDSILKCTHIDLDANKPKPFSYEPIDPDEKARNIIEILRLNYTDIELADALIRLRDILIADLREQAAEIYDSLKEIELAIQKLS